jgi:MOSC domain-containing protein YiiM
VAVEDRVDRSTRALVSAVPQTGRLTTILLRGERRATPTPVAQAEVTAGLGLIGDHRTHGRAPDPSARRQVTLLQAEHLPVVAALTGHEEVDPAWLRRNLVVAGINLASLRDRRFRIGTVGFEGSGWCHPCSRMEETLGPGGFQAMRGHGGITARVLTSGTLHLGDPVHAVGDPPDRPDPDVEAATP